MLGYDGCKTYTQRYNLMEDTPALHFLASISGAFFAVTCAVPFDLVMIKYQTNPGVYRGGILDCATQIYKEGGAMAFFRGWTPLFLRVAIVISVYMPAYEQVRAKVLKIGYFK